MNRDLISLASQPFDVLVVGGGIYGAAISWEAASRGLSVALVERNDFGAHTSANSLKIIHGGIRYLQHLDLKRLRRSAGERKILMRIAPHLVHPLPTLVPTYGHGLKGREMMRFALATYDLLTLDRNRVDDPAKHIPRGRLVGAADCRDLLPGVPEEGLNGGAIYYDAQVHNSERLILAFVKSAHRNGAVVANYAEVTSLLHDDSTVAGVTVQDRMSGDAFDIRARLTVNATGPWVPHVSRLAEGVSAPALKFAKAFNIVSRPLFENYAVGIPSPRSLMEPGAIVQTGSRLFFVAPWRNRSIIGTDYVTCTSGDQDVAVTEQEATSFLKAFNQAMPAANLAIGDVTFVHSGLLPTTNVNSASDGVQIAKRPTLHDHRFEGVEGLISVVGVKYTTARAVAEKVVDRILDRSVDRSAPSRTAQQRLVGGEIDRITEYIESEKRSDRFHVGSAAVEKLICNYGSEYPKVLRLIQGERRDWTSVVRAQVTYAVEHEMAQSLADVVFRRTDLGTAGHPGGAFLGVCATEMARILDWDDARIRNEVDRVKAAYPGWIPIRNGDDGGELANSTLQ